MDYQKLGAEKLVEIRQEVDSALATFLDENLSQVSAISPDLADCAKALRAFAINSGKRFRPTFAIAAANSIKSEIEPSNYKAVVALELIHVCALIHDDLMDGSDTRRGEPSIHKLFEGKHGKANWRGQSENFGSAAAILIGDLALVLADKALHEAGLAATPFIQTLKIYDELKVELMAGQFLDVFEQTQGGNSVERALEIATYKSGKYSIERPLHFGAAMAASESDFEKYQDLFTQYGIPLGIAFQLRDDLLGVFGDPTVTGKPAGDDLREGKRTALISTALGKLDSDSATKLNQLLGRPDLTAQQIKELQSMLIESGAVIEIEVLIESQVAKSRAALDNSLISELGKAMLEILIEKATKRSY